ncbi:MAG: lamin tail domain-containing protein [Deltaproteobacteria bacterium]|nr:lamin tail domain-containing protein [Deltaproteobacteria bacterium]
MMKKILVVFALTGLLSMGCDDDVNSNSGECLDGYTQEGTTVCGLNDEGVYIQDCIDQVWVDSENCTGTDECTNSDEQESDTVCGLNDEGFLLEECREGQWEITDSCSGTDVCTNEETRTSGTGCGENDEGYLLEECVDGQWTETQQCQVEPECEGNETTEGTTVCGLNDEGYKILECVDGFWQETENCSGTDECVNEEESLSEDTCGYNDEGYKVLLCVEGTWSETGECSGTDVCINETTTESLEICGENDEGFFLLECVGGQWQETENCSGTDECHNTDEREGSTLCGINDEGVKIQVCTNGVWVDTETCTGGDECLLETTQVGSTPCGFNNSGVFEQECPEGLWVDTENCLNEKFVVINEVLTGGGGWVELYNNSDSDIDISNWRITNGGNTYSVPASTQINALGYYIIDAVIGETDADFTLSNASMEIQDAVSWTGTYSLYGRYPNGSGTQQELYIYTKSEENTNLQPLDIDWCDTHFPTEINALVSEVTTVYGTVFVDGYTGEQGVESSPEPQIKSRLCYTDGTSDTCIDADFNSFHTGNNDDEYMADISFDAPGYYMYWYEFSGDLGNTWTSCEPISDANITEPVICDLSGYTIVQHDSEQSYTIAEGTVLNPGQVLLLLRNADKAAFELYKGITIPPDTIVINSGNKMPLINGDEVYELLDTSSTIVDGPTTPLVSGNAYLRTDSSADPFIPASWIQVAPSLGTPGTSAPTLLSNTGKPVITEIADQGEYVYEYIEITCDK